MKRLITAALLIIMALIPLSSYAQKQIENVIKTIENRKVEYVAFTEKRNPSTHKVYESTKVMIVNDGVYSKRLIDAIMHSRTSSTSFKIGAKNKFYNIEFTDHGDITTYTFLKEKSHWILTVKIVAKRNRPDKSQSSLTITADDEFGCNYSLLSLPLDDEMTDMIERIIVY